MPEIERRLKKPFPIEVLLFDGANTEQVDEFTGRQISFGRADGQIEVWNSQEKAWQVVPVGHRVAKSTLGEFYPLSQRAYEETTEPAEGRPRIVCLCGSTRFGDAFREANLRLTLEGAIVLSIGCDMKTDTDLAAAGALGKDPEAVKRDLDELHRRKIDLAGEVLVVSRDGYFGPSTAGEIAYAVAHGKTVRFAEDAARERAHAAGLVPAARAGLEPQS